MLKSLKNKWFGHKPRSSGGDGIYASIDELLEQRQYISYLKSFHRRLTSSRQSGDVKSAFRGRGIELEELRAYNYGDDVRDIDWRVTARKLSPFTRLYNEEKDREIYVLLDLSPYMAFGTRKELKSVAAAKITALLAWLCLEHKDRFGLCIFDGANEQTFKPSNNRGGVVAMLKKVAESSQNILNNQKVESQSLSKPLRIMSHLIKGRASMFVVSDFSRFDLDCQKSLAQMSRKCDIYCIDVFDVLEDTAPAAGEYMVSSGSGKSLIFNSSAKSFRAEYQHYFTHKREQIKDLCHKFGARYFEVRTDKDLHKQLQIF